MIYFLAIGAIGGTLLGLRYKVFVLVPATLIAAFAIVATLHGARTIAVTILTTTILLQIGYVLGCIAHAYTDAYSQGRTALRQHASRSHPA
jgi:heme/copper-type cytochrome/quinol oxidase subunit 3